MEKRFGSDNVSILELPEAKRINSERYSEFGKAFKYIRSTEYFEIEIEKRFLVGTKPLWFQHFNNDQSGSSSGSPSGP